jgi:hypothetical protein
VFPRANSSGTITERVRESAFFVKELADLSRWIVPDSATNDLECSSRVAAFFICAGENNEKELRHFTAPVE